jgi:hypothetical protein
MVKESLVKMTRLKAMAVVFAGPMIAGILAYQLAFHWRMVRLAHAAAPASPFTLKYQSIRKSVSGQQVTEDVVQAIRSDGSKAVLSTNYALPGYPGFPIRRLIFAEGKEVLINDATKTQSTTFANAAELAHRNTGVRLDPMSDCIKRTNGQSTGASSVGREMLLGVKVVKLLSIMSELSRTSWVAPSLGCVIIQQHEEFHNLQTGESRGVVDQVPISLILGEPEATLFMPAEYDEVPPSVMDRKWAEYHHVEPPDSMVKRWTAKDRTYYEHQK